MQAPDLPTYVTDTHSLYWYRRDARRLSPAADAAFRLAAAGGARIVVPTIVVAEFYYLTEKAGYPVVASELIDHISGSREFTFSELGQSQLEKMEEVTGVLEMHDRLIAAEALVHQAPIISKDAALRAIGVVQVIW